MVWCTYNKDNNDEMNKIKCDRYNYRIKLIIIVQKSNIVQYVIIK